ncbi:hypothetical protein LWI28_018619 [Acer negundo]|uniref:Uncharacterized protein n=1 Tax=Acer negundo TaxID=4023 RepID=A0AAD5JME6_ACENE|nr:hypothetical protein LWI28_018619 [Acer negundo]
MQATRSMLFEEEMYAGEIMNVIAHEGTQRIERPETYKQWQVQNLRARLSTASAERIEATGCHLAKYCERFNVRLEYNGIASQNWEAILIEDLKIKTGEVLAVNCTCFGLKTYLNQDLIIGFKQLPLNQELMKELMTKLKACYPKDFVIDEDKLWMLHGWKGRIVGYLHRIHVALFLVLIGIFFSNLLLI